MRQDALAVRSVHEREQAAGQRYANRLGYVADRPSCAIVGCQGCG